MLNIKNISFCISTLAVSAFISGQAYASTSSQPNTPPVAGSFWQPNAKAAALLGVDTHDQLHVEKVLPLANGTTVLRLKRERFGSPVLNENAALLLTAAGNPVRANSSFSSWTPNNRADLSANDAQRRLEGHFRIPSQRVIVAPQLFLDGLTQRYVSRGYVLPAN